MFIFLFNFYLTELPNNKSFTTFFNTQDETNKLTAIVKFSNERHKIGKELAAIF